MRSQVTLRIFLSSALVSTFFLQLGCTPDSRMQKPIDDFQSATSVVTAQARVAYGELNRVELIRAVKTATRLHQRLDPKSLEKNTRVLAGEDLATRLDALASLDKYAKLLSEIVKSDLPDKIAGSAANLETSLNGLAARIEKLANAVRGGAGGDADGGGDQPNTLKFKEKFGVFAAVAREVLGFLAKQKRDDALKRAIKDGDKPVNELIDALKDDLSLSWVLKRKNLDNDMVLIYQAYNGEVTKAAPDQARLNELRDAVIANIEASDVFYATDPTDALDKMQMAHSKMVEYANRPLEASFTETIAAIDAFLSSATRLGNAVIKLKTIDNQNS